MCIINYQTMIYTQFFTYKCLWHCNYDEMCYHLPAVDINNHIINDRHQHTHTCHYVTQIVPVFVHTDDKTYNCSASAEYRC